MKAASIAVAALAVALAAAAVTAHEGGGHPSGGHDCVHDHLLDTLGAHGENPTHQEPVAPQSYPHQRPDPNNGHRHLLGTFGSIRIHLDTSRIWAGEPGDTEQAALYERLRPFESAYICRHSGDTYLASTANDGVQRTCSEADVLTDAKREYLVGTTLAEARAWFQRTLSVQPVDGNLQLYQPGDGFCAALHVVCCESESESGIPPEHWETGIPNTDFVLYATARPTGGATIAWALTCQSDQNGRPVAGHANFGPALIDTDPAKRGDQISTAIHEIGHALGFSGGKFSSFRVPGTNQLRGYSNVLRTFSERGHSVSKIVTENVIAKVKEHFGCDEWLNAGGEIEDFGSAGTAGSHWEKRLFMNEFMTGTASLNSIYSEVTLALFEDSGWYQVNYASAEKLAWGNQEGCDFAGGLCSEWSDRYFCTERHAQGCSPDALSKAVCNLYNYPADIASYYRYFPGQSKTGGGRQYADYCPFYESFVGGDCRDPDTRTYWFYGEVTGQDSRCFTGDYILADTADAFGTGRHYGCLETRCDALTNRLYVNLAGRNSDGSDSAEILCPIAGGTVQMPTNEDGSLASGYLGSIDCPPTRVVCTGDPCDRNTCDGHGECQSDTGECECYPPYFGSTPFRCDRVACPVNAETGETCSGEAAECETVIGQPNAGRCVCNEGRRGFACEDVGCPLPPGIPLPTGDNAEEEIAQLECSGPDRGTCDQETGVCDCNTEAGIIQYNACELTDCDRNPENDVKCSGTFVDSNGQTLSRGTCDDASGLCMCAQQVAAGVDDISVQGHPGLEGTHLVHFGGSDCSVARLGEPYTCIWFAGAVPPPVDELDPCYDDYAPFYSDGESSSSSGSSSGDGTSTAEPIDLTLAPKAWTYFKFNVESTDYDQELVVTIQNAETESGGFGTTDPRLVQVYACYESNCIPSAAHNDFQVSEIDLWSPTKSILFKSENSSATLGNGRRLSTVSGIAPNPSNARFDRTEAMLIAVVTTDERGADVRVSLERNPCDQLYCGPHGECVNDAYGAGCICNRGWSGTLCDVMDCPGTPDCGGQERGTCTVDPRTDPELQVPVCECSDGFTGEDCNNVDTTNFLMVEPTLGTTQNFNGSVRIGNEQVYYLEVPDSVDVASLFVSMTALQHGADGMMLVRSTVVPSLVRDASTRFDNNAWIQEDLTQRVVLEARGGNMYFIRILNGRYATVNLDFMLSVQLYDTCPPGLNNCGGPDNGECVRECVCKPGWGGLTCEKPVTPLADRTEVNVGRMGVGAWKYYVFEAPASVLDMEVKLRQVVHAPRSQPIVLVAAVPEALATSIRRVTSDAAMFDFDQFTSRAEEQTLVIRKGATSQLYYIGVHNTRHAVAPVDLTLQVVTHETPAFDAAGEGCDDEGNDETCGQLMCHGRGAYSEGERGPFCQCESGWNSATFCNTPSFSSFVRLQQAAQEVGFLCNLCLFNRTMTTNEMQIYKIPQPLQTATGLTLHVEALPDMDTGNPSILVSEYLPRHLFDFVYVSSSVRNYENLTLRDPSPTGRYWMVVYANQDGNYLVRASRDSLGAATVLTSSFLRELSIWMTTDQTGQMVTAMAGTLAFCVCCFCSWQLCTSGSKKTKEELVKATTEFASGVRAASARNLVPLPHAHHTAPNAKLNAEMRRLGRSGGGGVPPAGYTPRGPPPGHPPRGAPPPPGVPPNHAQQEQMRRLMQLQQRAQAQAAGYSV